jgi:hypothetical protein
MKNWALASLLFFAVGQSALAGPRLMFPGPKDTDDATFPVKLGKKWWAFCVEPSSSTLKPVKLQVKMLEASSAKFRFDVGTPNCPAPLFFLKNRAWKWLKAREIPTAKIVGDQPEQQIVFQDHKIFLREREDGERNRGVYLEIDGSSRRIFGLNEQIWNLKWAGDLDDDGKIDLLIGITNVDDDEEGEHPEYKLFLSTYGDDIDPVYPAVKTIQ